MNDTTAMVQKINNKAWMRLIDAFQQTQANIQICKHLDRASSSRQRIQQPSRQSIGQWIKTVRKKFKNKNWIEIEFRESNAATGFQWLESHWLVEWRY